MFSTFNISNHLTINFILKRNLEIKIQKQLGFFPTNNTHYACNFMCKLVFLVLLRFIKARAISGLLTFVRAIYQVQQNVS